MLLARMVEGHGEVLAIDNNNDVIRQADEHTRTSGISNLTFEVGDAYKLPFSTDFADLVICNNLLCNLSDVELAVQEMYRITKRDRLLAVAEPAGKQQFYDPESKRSAYLSEKLNESLQRGWASKGADQSVGLRVPEILLRNGVKDIIAEAVCQIFLMCDPRREDQDIEDQLRTEASVLPDATLAMLKKGGMSEKEFKEHNFKAMKRLSGFISNPDQVCDDGYVRVMSPLLLFVGKKP